MLKTRQIKEIFRKIEEKYGQDRSLFPTLLHLSMPEITDSHLIFRSSYPILNTEGKKEDLRVFRDCMEFLEKLKKKGEAGLELAEMKMGHKDQLKSLKKIFTLTKQRLSKNQSVEK